MCAWRWAPTTPPACRSAACARAAAMNRCGCGSISAPRDNPVPRRTQRESRMSIHVALNHVTHYRYDRPVNLGPQVVRLRPAPHSRTRILSYSMRVEPEKHFENWQQDPQSNYLARLVFPDKTTSFRIEVDLVAEMSVLNPFDFFLEPSAENFPFDYDPALAHELGPYLEKTPLTPRFAAYLESISREKMQTTNFLVALNQRLQKDIAYLIRMEPGVQTPELTLCNASGSCRDSGWLLVQLLRHLGLAARFVSGYLIQLKSDVKSLDGPSGTEGDFTDLHAWCEVYLPGAGWIGLDPTSGLLAGEGHIPLACSPDPSSAAPVTGALEECKTEFEHHMSVSRVWEAPRVTLPYSDEQWAGIESLGHQVDADLRRNDVRLTQGGEPTFVSVDDRDGDEWNTDALGPTKRLLSADLMDQLCRKYGEGGLLHYGQGKWYPGEQLPRWSRGPWFLRAGRCYLIPGDSPLGLRLPLDSQPWVSETDRPWVQMPDPSQSFPPLPPYRLLRYAAGADEAKWPAGVTGSD